MDHARLTRFWGTAMTQPGNHAATLPPGARWAAVLVLGGLGIAGVARGLLGDPPSTLGAHTPSPALADHVQSGPGPAAGEGAAQASEAGPIQSPAPGVARLININTATAAELDLLPGIGPALAGRIIEYREANGPYSRLDDLDEVSGIGPKTIAKLVPYATAE